MSLSSCKLTLLFVSQQSWGTAGTEMVAVKAITCEHLSRCLFSCCAYVCHVGLGSSWVHTATNICLQTQMMTGNSTPLPVHRAPFPLHCTSTPLPLCGFVLNTFHFVVLRTKRMCTTVFYNVVFDTWSVVTVLVTAQIKPVPVAAQL